jgi:hypothetical protein
LDAIDGPGTDGDQEACLVVDHLGKVGLIYCESDVETADVENVIADLLDGQFFNPIRIISFSVADGWSRDISARGGRRGGGAFLSLSSVRGVGANEFQSAGVMLRFWPVQRCAASR